jgi:Lhr-like helicase
VFTLAGRKLEYITTKEMTALVRKSNAKKSIVPSWQGGRMPLSANLGKKLREQLSGVSGVPIAIGRQVVSGVEKKREKVIELEVLEPLFELQGKISHVPKANELLIEQIETKDGFHLFVYPFEGRLVHEAMAAILAYRISRIRPITFSFAMNDYGFELLSDQPIPVDDTNVYDLFSPDELLTDIQRSVNATEMARRKFRDVAVIGGLVFQGMPGEKKKARHLQSVLPPQRFQNPLGGQQRLSHAARCNCHADHMNPSSRASATPKLGAMAARNSIPGWRACQDTLPMGIPSGPVSSRPLAGHWSDGLKLSSDRLRASASSASHSTARPRTSTST